MATSGNYSFDLSTGGIIRVAYQRIGILAAGLDPDSNQYAMGRDMLQVALLALQNKGIQLRSVLQTTETLTAGTAEYTAPANGIDIDEHTVYVSNASGIDLPLIKVSRGQYMALSNKASSAPPSQIYVEKGATLKYFLYPTPDSQYTTITFPLILLQPDMTSAANTTGLPTNYLETVILKLGVALCDHHGLSERKKQLKEDLGESSSEAVNNDTERGPIQFRVEPGLRFGRRW
jgi:hypothetical protein